MREDLEIVHNQEDAYRQKYNASVKDVGDASFSHALPSRLPSTAIALCLDITKALVWPAYLLTLSP